MAWEYENEKWSLPRPFSTLAGLPPAPGSVFASQRCSASIHPTSPAAWKVEPTLRASSDHA